jgi:hypothetical protein
MTIDEYLKSKEITDVELSSHFKLVKTIEIDCQITKGCYNCGDLFNNHRLKTPSWTNAQYCWCCNSINFVFVSDRMGGNYTDTVKIYQNI